MALLERGSSLQDLSAALGEVIRGLGRIALVSGEAGIGKTVLVEQFVRRQTNAVRGLWGACDALFTPRPLGPLYEMTSHAQEPLAGLLAADANHTTSFTTFLNALQGRPVLAVFEDVHWADEATLDLLRFLGRRIMRTTTLLVLTAQPSEATPA